MSYDRYSIKFLCPKCKADGVVHVVENDGWAFMRNGPQRSIGELSKGFLMQGTPRQDAYVGGDMKIFCEACDVPVVETNAPSEVLVL